MYYATVYAAIQDVIEPRLRGIAVALYFCFMYILGASMGPWATGCLSDHFAHKAMTDAGASVMTEAFKAIGLHNAMYIIPILALAAAAGAVRCIANHGQGRAQAGDGAHGLVGVVNR